MSIHFISDIHLDPSREDTYNKFRNYLKTIQADADELYILGDLFEYWIGDDGLDLLGHQPAVRALQELSASGTKIFIMHGNRDFLIGEDFLKRFNGTLLADPSIIQLHGESVLLMHGDSLCTDDIAHQRYREIVLDPLWQQEVLKLSLEERLKRALDMRMQSQRGRPDKTPELMDVNLLSVTSTMEQHGVQVMIHGHVHRTAIHHLKVNNNDAVRYVLGDWDSGRDGVIRADADGSINLHPPEFH